MVYPAVANAKLDRLTDASILAMYRKFYETVGDAPWLDELCNHNPASVAPTEEMELPTGSPGLRKFDGKRTEHDYAEASFVCTSHEFEGTRTIRVREMRQARRPLIEVSLQQDIARAKDKRAELTVETVLLGHDTVAQFGPKATFDKANFFGNGHVNGQDNIVAATAGDVAEMEVALRKAVKALRMFQDDQGNYVNRRMTECTVFCPPDLEELAIAALKAGLILEGGQTRNNILQYLGITWKVRSEPMLSDGINGAPGWGNTKMGVFRTDSPAKPLFRQTEQDITITPFGQDTEYAKWHKRVAFLMDAILGAGYHRWDHGVRVDFS